MNNDIKVLIVEDSEDDTLLLVRDLRNGGFGIDYLRVNSEKTYKDALEEFNPDIIISDYFMPGFSGVEALAIRNDFNPDIPFIITSGAIGEDTAVEMMRNGANDYLVKDNMKRLVPAVKRSLDEYKIRYERKLAFEHIRELNISLEKKVDERTEELKNTNNKLENEIKERIKAENELRATRNFMNTILENIPDMIYVKDAKTLKFTYLNSAVEELIGFSKKEMIGKDVHDIFSENLANYYTDNDRKVLASNVKVDTIEELIKSKDNIVKLFLTKKLLIRNENGEPKYILGISEDLTEKKKAETARKFNELRFIKLFRSSPIAISIIKLDSNTIYDINDSFLNMLDYSRDEIKGSNLQDIDTWQDKEQRNKLIQQAITNGYVQNVEVHLKKKNGDIITALTSLEHLQMENEEPWLIFMYLDISKRKVADLEMQKSLEKEKRLNFLKSRFISMVSHEFRAPLTTIMLSTDMLKTYGKNWNEEEKGKHYKRIQDTIYRMTQLMENVLTIGKIESGKFEFHPESIDLPSFCESIAENIQFSCDRNQKIEFLFKGGCEDAKVDENLLGLVLSNLLSNALKYSPEGAKVDFEVYCHNNEAVFTIRDYGIGIPESDLPHLFNSFFRASNVKEAVGYGLGLSIVKNCIKAHKGTVDVSSEVNKGTTFIVKIPIV